MILLYFVCDIHQIWPISLNTIHTQSVVILHTMITPISYSDKIHIPSGVILYNIFIEYSYEIFIEL